MVLRFKSFNESNTEKLFKEITQGDFNRSHLNRLVMTDSLFESVKAILNSLESDLPILYIGHNEHKIHIKTERGNIDIYRLDDEYYYCKSKPYLLYSMNDKYYQCDRLDGLRNFLDAILQVYRHFRPRY